MRRWSNRCRSNMTSSTDIERHKDWLQSSLAWTRCCTDIPASRVTVTAENEHKVSFKLSRAVILSFSHEWLLIYTNVLIASRLCLVMVRCKRIFDTYSPSHDGRILWTTTTTGLHACWWSDVVSATGDVLIRCWGHKIASLWLNEVVAWWSCLTKYMLECDHIMDLTRK